MVKLFNGTLMNELISAKQLFDLEEEGIELEKGKCGTNHVMKFAEQIKATYPMITMPDVFRLLGYFMPKYHCRVYENTTMQLNMNTWLLLLVESKLPGKIKETIENFDSAIVSSNGISVVSEAAFVPELNSYGIRAVMIEFPESIVITKEVFTKQIAFSVGNDLMMRLDGVYICNNCYSVVDRIDMLIENDHSWKFDINRSYFDHIDNVRSSMGPKCTNCGVVLEGLAAELSFEDKALEDGELHVG